jgi:hypothetical protein
MLYLSIKCLIGMDFVHALSLWHKHLIDICLNYSVQLRKITGSRRLPGTWTTKYMSVITLIKRGGGKRPDEARQPAVQTGRVPIPAVHAMPQDEGTVQDVQPLQRGVFLCLKSPYHALCIYIGLSNAEKYSIFRIEENEPRRSL